MQAGTIVADRFEIERLAGSGGMGSVFRAMDRTQRGPVALKILAGANPTDRERFRREARLLAELRHPNIVRYVADGETREGQAWLAMEWLEGEDLGGRLDRGPLSAVESVTLVRKAASALGAAHKRGVVHRDVKPTNLFLPGRSIEHVKVLDFGIARVGAGIDRPMTRTGIVVGTPGYIAPEQARGSKEVDARADVFALGCVLFACLTGRAPFVGDSLMSVLAKVLVTEAPRITSLWPDAPIALDELAARLMSQSPDARPADAGEVARLLELLGDLPDARRGSIPPKRTALTTAEQRLKSVILIESELGPDPSAVASQSGAGDLERQFADQETIAADDTVDATAPADTGSTLWDIVHRFQGRLEVLEGGARLVTLDGAGVATDQAARAARCALAMRARLPDLPMVLATGRGGSGRPGSGGDVVDRAARMLLTAGGDARAGGRPLPVLIDDVTMGLLGDRFAVDEASAGFLLRGERETFEGVRRVLGKATPCVGRDRELGTLRALLDECTTEPVARVALLTGPAGVGKSRIRQELLARVRQQGEHVEVWIARGDAMSAGAPLDMLAQAIRGAAGISGGEPAPERRDKLARRAARHVAAADAPRVARFLGEIAGAPFPSEGSRELAAARDDAVLMGDQTRRAFEDLVAAECAVHPLMIVLEDLQWGDLPTVRFVDGALRNLADRPLFVLATGRTEVHQRFPSLWEERSPQEIRVGALTPKASEKLVRHVLGDRASRDVIDRVVGRAGGHALLLEEIVRAVAEGKADALPDTVLAMVEARIGALEPEARRVLRAASVFGRTFCAGGVGALLGADQPAQETRAWLEELVDREWIARRDAPRFPGEDELGFRQDIAREAAYGMLTDLDRELGHKLAGAWLEKVGEESGVVLARHHELGGEAGRAIDAWARAAEQALEGNDFAAALEHGDRAAALGADVTRLGRLSAMQAEALVHRGEFEAARDRAHDALDRVGRADPAWCRAAAALTHATGKLGDLPGLETAVRELLALDVGDSRAAGAAPDRRVGAFATACSNAAVQLTIGGSTAIAGEVIDRLSRLAEAVPEDPAVQGWAARARGVRAAFGGDQGQTLGHLRAAIAAFEAAGDLRMACGQKKTQGWYACECGAIEEGERALREAIGVAERLGLANLVPHAKHDIGSPLVRAGKLAEAARFQEEAIEAFAAQGDRRLESGAHGLLSWARRLQGDLVAAEREARLALAIAPSDPIKVPAYAFLAAVELEAGRAEDALATAREGLRVLEACGVTEEGVSMLHLAHAEALWARGMLDEARAAIAAARDGVLARAAKIGDPDLRASFVARIAENARTLSLCEEWGAG